MRRECLLVVALLAAVSCSQRIGLNTNTRGKVVRDPEFMSKHPDVRAVVSSNNAFGFNLRAVLPSQGNLLFSPASVHSAMAMTYAGARGETAAQMAAVLHLSLPESRLHPAFADLLGALNSVPTGNGNQPTYTLAVANILWGQKGVSFRSQYVNLTESIFQAALKSVDFVGATEVARQTINSWVAKRTNNRVDQLIASGQITTDTRLVLTNTVFFRSTWDRPFARKDTRDMPFYLAGGETVTVPMMSREHTFRYLEEWGLQLVELPYRGAEISLIAILPRPGEDLAAIERRLDPTRFEDWMSLLRPELVEVTLPRFTFRAQLSLREPLVKLGMELAFDHHRADLGGMFEPLPIMGTYYLSDVMQNSFVTIDEEGTEAAAGSAAMVREWASGSDESNQKVFRADRPFLLILRHRFTGQILFLGRVANPKA